MGRLERVLLLGIHCYLRDSSKIHFHRYASGTAILALVLATAACSSSPSSPASSSGSGGSGSYVACLAKHGVTPASKPSPSTVTAAGQACAALAPAARPASSATKAAEAALQKIENCLSSHGVALPTASPSSSKSLSTIISQLKTNPKFQTAAKACIPSAASAGGS